MNINFENIEILPAILQAVFDLVILIVMLFASKDDIKTRLVPPKYQIALGITSLVHMATMPIVLADWKLFLNYLLTGLFVFTIYIVAVLIFKTGIGGADTKVTSIMASFLGWKQTICFIISHALVAIGLSFFRLKNTGIKTQSVPLMPFLMIGFVITKAIYWLGQFGIIGLKL